MSTWPQPPAHQTQPTYNSCVSTCIAMVLGEPAQKVIDELHNDYQKYREIALARYLREREYLISIPSISDNPHYHLLAPGHYILGVPSLNHKGGSHAILYTCFIDPDDGVTRYTISDPAEGREGSKHYTLHESGKIAEFEDDRQCHYEIMLGIRK